jgi:hypothetical protein
MTSSVVQCILCGLAITTEEKKQVLSVVGECCTRFMHVECFKPVCSHTRETNIGLHAIVHGDGVIRTIITRH